MLDKPDDQGADARTVAQKERDAIAVESHDGREEGDTEGGNDNTSDDENNEDEDDNEEDDKEKEEEENNETDEEKAARVAQEKEDRRQSRIQKRIDKLTASNKNYETEIAKLNKQLEAKPIEGVTEDDIERMAEERANKKLQEKLTADAQKAFNKKCDVLEGDASKIDKNIEKKINEMVSEIGAPIPAPVIEIIFDLHEEEKIGGKLLNYLTDNIDEAEEIFSMSERRMTQRLMRISDKLKDSPSKPAKQRSNLPDPITTIRERNTNSDAVLTGKESMDDFARKRAKQVEERMKARGY